MARIFADRVADTTATAGTGALSLNDAALNGYRRFRDVLSDADTIFYSIQHRTLNQWEVGEATYGAGTNILTRTSVLSSSNSNSTVNFSSGLKDIVASAPASFLSTVPFVDSPVAMTTGGTVSTAYNQKLIACGGSAFYTVTLSAASNYPTPFWVDIINVDTLRAKRISPNGLTSFRLWPGQCVRVFNYNNAWWATPCRRFAAPGASIVYLNSGGSDSNDGMATGTSNAMATMFGAVVTMVSNEWDLRGGVSPCVTFQLADGTYTTGLHMPGQVANQNGHAGMVFQGNSGTPSNVIIAPASGGCFEFFDHAWCEVQSMKLSPPSGEAAILADSFSTVRGMGGLVFDAVAGGGVHNYARNGGQIIHDGGYTIAGGAGYHALTIDGGAFFAQAQTAAFSADSAFTTFALSQRLSRQNWGLATIALGGKTVTGKRYEADDLSMISTFGGGANFLPGDSGGSTSGGGQYT